MTINETAMAINEIAMKSDELAIKSMKSQKKRNGIPIKLNEIMGKPMHLNDS